MPTTTLSAKKCVNCHKDVTHAKRMKDSSGRYWCVNCGTADQKKKAAASGGNMRQLSRAVSGDQIVEDGSFQNLCRLHEEE